jgi:signal transduction histidine kinase
VANALAIVGFIVSGLENSPAATGFGIAYVATALAIPVAIFLGLAMERLSLGRVLARFVSALGTVPANSVQNEMADTLNDPRLRIFYRNQGSESFVDSSGVELSRAAETDDRRQTVVQGAGRPLAVVDYDASLSDQEDFIKAAGKSAAIWLDTERLAAELASSRSSLEASRARLATTADDERRRIQRDLHDGAQQHLIGMHLKLELALEAIDEEPARSAALLAELGDELGETANDLRSLASDVFPPALTQYGLVEALRGAVRRMDVAVRFQASDVNRHPPELETPVYFACLEALQNVSKHGGVAADATLRLWEVKRRLFIEVRDSGNGFEPEAVTMGSGLQNMSDRLESVGGRLTVTSARGCGTVVRAVVPIRPRPGASRNGRAVWQPPASLKMPIA